MNGKSKALSMLGLAVKAGKVVSGETATEAAIKSFDAFLVIVAQDASDNTRKHFKDMCEFRDIPFCEFSTKEELGHAIGKDYRSNLAVTDMGLAKAVSDRINSERQEESGTI